MELADERLRPIGKRAFWMLGNDDPPSLAEPLQDAPWGEYSEGRVLALDDDHVLVSWGWANPTPWDSFREMSEEELGTHFEQMFAAAGDGARVVFNAHVPPHASGLDDAPVLDAELTVVQQAGQVKLGPVGSTAVRAAIERYQPIASIHGHVHESAGFRRIGRTIAFNPGSDYGTGSLNGALLTCRATSSSPINWFAADERRGAVRRRRRRYDERPGNGHRPRRRGPRRGAAVVSDNVPAGGMGRARPARLAPSGAGGDRGAASGSSAPPPTRSARSASPASARRLRRLTQPASRYSPGCCTATIALLRRRSGCAIGSATRRCTPAPGMWRRPSTSDRRSSGCVSTSRRRSRATDCFLQPRDLVLHALTGVTATDETHANSTLFFDLRARRWDERTA